jgi:hypothetical protein
VAFGDPGKGKAGSATARLEVDPNNPNQFRAAVDVVIRKGQSGTALQATVAHEGVHVGDAQDFAATATMDGHYDLSRNLTHWQTEMNAYGVTAAVQASANQRASYGTCGSGQCVFGPGMSAQQVTATTILLLANPANGYNRFVDTGGGNFVNVLGMRQFPDITVPNPRP